MFDELTKDYERMIADGAHWLIVCGDRVATVQPLTDLGYEALCHVLIQLGASQEVLARMGMKRRGFYCQAVPLEQGAEALAKFLLEAGLTGALVDTRVAHAGAATGAATATGEEAGSIH